MNGKSRGGEIDDYAHKVNVMTHWINVTFPSRSGGNLNSELNCGGLKENGFVKYLFLEMCSYLYCFRICRYHLLKSDSRTITVVANVFEIEARKAFDSSGWPRIPSPSLVQVTIT